MSHGSDRVGTSLRRTRLTQAILDAQGGGPVVTTVVAPAGYGKSALLDATAQRARELSGAPAAIRLSLEDCENHPSLALDLLAAAMQAALPTADLSPLIQLKRTASLDEYGHRLPYVLARILDSLEQPEVMLLVDDAETAREGEPLGEMLSGLMSAEPRRLRLVLASRRALPLDLRRWRASGELLELNGADLAFTEGEIGEFLGAALDRPPPPAIVTRLWRRTRGWPGVLALLTRVMQGRTDAQIAALVDEMANDRAAIATFVLDRVLAEYPPPLQYFTKVISVLERIEPSLVRALFQDAAQGPRGRRGGSRFVIALPDEHIPGYLDRLAETQLLTRAEGSDDAFEFNPLVRETLRHLLESEDTRVFREAHRRAADWRLRAGGPADAVCFGHLMAAGEFDRVLALLEDQAEAFFASGSRRQLGHWLTQLEAHYAALPFWANYYVGRIAVLAGDWDKARAYLDACRVQLGERRGTTDTWRWQPRLQLGYAAMYWRRGVRAEASTYCRRGLDYLRQLTLPADVSDEQRHELARVQLDLLNLLGTVRMEMGSYDKAQEVCVEARDLSLAHGFAFEEAVALRNLGRIAARQGRILEARDHLERALSRVEADDAAELAASLRYLLGLTDHMTGQHRAAMDNLREALRRALGAGNPESVAAMQASEGALWLVLGEGERAGAACRQALGTLEAVTDDKVRAEVLDECAIVLARAGDRRRAAALVEEATPLVSGLLRGDTHAAARHAEARAELAVERDMERALQHLQASQERYERIGCGWHAARLAWRSALWQHVRFAEGTADTPGEVGDELEKACSAALQHGYRFETGPEYHELLHVGAAYGGEATRACCQGWLATLDPAVRDAGLSERTATRYRDYRRRAELADDYVVIDRDERRGANARQVEQLIQEASPDALILVVHEQFLILGGERVSLGEKRVILPLLLHFLRFPDQIFTMDQLAAEVWGADDGRTSMQTKVKVAISRLRALLGKDRPYINTSRVDLPDGSGSVVGYGLAPDLRFQLVEQLEEPGGGAS
ncbi:MAG: tetratricopeptide repeat protein [Deltaproteobacteria bacterium]|nr:tetratricopeptide repeat protein [Deltaproteobacteria bacterium]MCB9788216.1 tetratricopeptide repeat protein [Deltaproteobacteria bacterium]